MDLHGGEVNVQWVCDRVCKNDGTHPQRQSLHEFFNSVDNDKHWFPGKHSGKRRGPQPVFTVTKKRRCAKRGSKLGVRKRDFCKVKTKAGAGKQRRWAASKAILRKARPRLVAGRQRGEDA